MRWGLGLNSKGGDTMQPDLKGLKGMIVTAGQMISVMPSHLETELSEDARYHLEEAEGNLGQFIEELDKTIKAIEEDQ